MKKIKDFLRYNNGYKKQVRTYDIYDGITVIGIFVFILVLYYLMGLVYSKQDIYLGYFVNPAILMVCLTFVVMKGLSLNTIGFSEKNLKESLLLGSIPGGIIIILSLLIGVIMGKELLPVANLVKNLLYFCFVIALVEEVIFRGYLQTRLNGLIKNPILAVIVGALMFMSIHIPFQMWIHETSAISFVTNNLGTLIIQFLWHIVLNFMYAKYNSIVAPTILHTFLNLSRHLFI